MKNIKKGIFSLLVITISATLVGCSQSTISNETDVVTKQEADTGVEQLINTAMGNYLIREVDLPTKSKDYITQDEEGNIYCFDTSDNCIIYKFNSDGSWMQQRQLELPSELRKIYKIFYVQDKIQIVFGSKKGEICVAKEKEQDNFEVFTLTKQGQPVQENVNGIYTIELDKAQNIYISVGMGDSNIQKYSGENGKWIKEYLDNVDHFIIMNERIYGVIKEEKVINVYDCVTGEVKNSIIYNGLGRTKLFKGLNEGELYACNEQGIMHLSGEDVLWEQVIVPERLNKGNLKVKDYNIYCYERSFLIHYDREGSNLLEECYYEAECATIPSRTVNINMFFENEQIRKAAEIYQKEHKDVLININSAIKGDRHIHEYILKSEELPSSEVDLVVLEGCVDGYIQDESLAELTDIGEALVEEEVLNENIARSIKKNDKYYIVPLNYGIGMICGNEVIINQIETIEDLAEYKKQHPEQILLGKTKLELFKQFIDVCFPSWFNEEGEFDKKRYRSFLESITILEEEKYENLNTVNYCYGLTLNSENKKAELLKLAKGETQLALVAAYSLDELGEIENLLKERKDLTQKELIGQGAKGIYTAGSIMAINVHSENQDIIKEIIKIALSEEVQTVGSEHRISVNEQVFSTQLNNAIQSEENKALYSEFKEWNDNIEICINVYDYKKYATIYEETKQYCMGTQTMNTTVEDIQSTLRSIEEENLESCYYHID